MTPLFQPEIGNRFAVSFFSNHLQLPLDVAFQRVSGLSRELSVSSHQEGGNNVGTYYFPQRVTHGSLVLERGVMTLTNLGWMFDDVLNEFHPHYLDVVVMLNNSLDLPVCCWTLTKALPVKWQTGDLDANSNTVLVNTLELSYQAIQRIGVSA